MEDILLVGEAINQAVLDCGASQTVCGTEWYKCFLESLEDVEEYNSNTIFKFGVGKLKASMMTKIPVTICGKKILLKVHVVDTDIPLLLSRSSMKELGMSLDLPNDTAITKSENGKNEFKLNVSDSGHYILAVLESTENKIH